MGGGAPPPAPPLSVSRPGQVRHVGDFQDSSMGPGQKERKGEEKGERGILMTGSQISNKPVPEKLVCETIHPHCPENLLYL